MTAPYEFGVIVWCDSGDGWWCDDFPELKRVLDFAREKLGCEWVRFDEDAEGISDLPRFEW